MPPNIGLALTLEKSYYLKASIRILMSQLTHLRTFLAVYRAGSVTKASLQLAITQPAASGHIKALEAHLKRSLFRRVGRGIEPTAAADWLARAAAPYLDGLEETLGVAAMRPNGLAGPLRLGGPAEFLAGKVLPGLGGLPELGMHLETKFGLTQDLVEHLEAGQLDLVVATVRIPRKAIGYQGIYREDFVLVGAPKWAAKVPPELVAKRGAEAVIDLPWLAYGPELPIIRRYFRQVFRARPPKKVVQIVPDLRALAASCAAGLGLTVLPSYLCATQLRDGTLVRLHEPTEIPGNEIFLAWNRLGLQQPRVAFMRRRLLETAADW